MQLTYSLNKNIQNHITSKSLLQIFSINKISILKLKSILVYLI